MQIRIMTIEDYDSVYHLWSSTPGVGMRSLDDSKSGIQKFLTRNPTTNFVATADNKIVGVTLSGHDGRRGTIYHTAVQADYRGQGIGKALIQSVHQTMRDEGINKVCLVVFKSNEIGNGFWKAQDWELRNDLNYYNKSLNIENL